MNNILHSTFMHDVVYNLAHEEARRRDAVLCDESTCQGIIHIDLDCDTSNGQRTIVSSFIIKQ